MEYRLARIACCGFLGNYHVGNADIDRRYALQNYDKYRYVYRGGRDVPCLYEDLDTLLTLAKAV